jgi:DNA repair ATPase RecN
MQTIESKAIKKVFMRFKIYENIVCLNDGLLYQLQHCPSKRTKVFRKLTYNEKRNAYYINGQLVTRKRLENLAVQ